MSVVVIGHVCWSTQPLLFVFCGIPIILLVGFSRVYARSRFPHQVVGSWVLGLGGLVASMHCCERMGFHLMKDFGHGVCVALIGGVALISFALAVENNDSRLAYIPKDEFIRVISDIINGVGNDIIEEDEGAGEADDLGGLGAGGPTEEGRQTGSAANTARSSSTLDGFHTARTSASSVSGSGGATGSKMLKQRRKGPDGRVKSDSLYFLQKSMERREQRERARFYESARKGAGDYRYSGARFGGFSATDGDNDDAYDSFSDGDYLIGSHNT